jgi:DUF971 family protein
MTRQSQPTEIAKVSETAIRIRWSDGHEGTYSTRYLRGSCQCAACVDEWTGERHVAIDHIPEEIRALKIAPVGQYAIQIDWSDGHSTGIYAFDVLRKLCPCAACLAAPISTLSS